jgi:hypothetical protein
LMARRLRVDGMYSLKRLSEFLWKK